MVGRAGSSIRSAVRIGPKPARGLGWMATVKPMPLQPWPDRAVQVALHIGLVAGSCEVLGIDIPMRSSQGHIAASR